MRDSTTVKNQILSIFSDCSCDSIEVHYNGPLEYTFESIYGYYVRQEDLINGRPWYKNDAKSIWWYELSGDWELGRTIDKGSKYAVTYLHDNGECLPNISYQKWKLGNADLTFTDAKNQVQIRCGYRPKGIDAIPIFHTQRT